MSVARKEAPDVRPLSERPEARVGARSAASVLLDHLEAQGTDCIFGVPGSATTPIYEALKMRGGVRHILAKHEEGAGFMAYGYARAKQGLGVCMSTTGPGATNLLTAIACARADSVPVLAITGQNALRHYGRSPLQDSSPLGIDIVGLFRHVTKLSSQVPSAEHTDSMMERAIRTALTGRPGPVHLGVPVDIQRQPASAARRSPSAYCVQGRPVDADAVVEAARLLAGARHPAILVGHGATISGAWDALFELATRERIPVATTPKGKGLFPESHPLSLGVFGFGGHLRAESYLFDLCDVLVVVGSSLAELTTHDSDPKLRPSRALVQIDLDPEEIGKTYPVELGVVGDARAALGGIAAWLERRREGGGAPSRPEDPLSELRASLPPTMDDDYLSASGSPIKPQRLVHEMRAELDDDALLVVDNGNCIIWANHYFEARAPLTYFLSLGFASMGNAVASAIGAKLAAPDKQVVALVGDAAFAMNGMEVHTAVDHRIGVVWVVLNNGGHGMVYHGERMLSGSDNGANRFEVPIDVSGLARAMGAEGVTVESAPAFRAALRRALASGRPTVIDAHIDPEEVPRPLLHRARAVARSLSMGGR